MIALVFVAGVVLLIDLVLILSWIFNFKDERTGIADAPLVSILIAARNEEQNLTDTLDSILQLDYPADKLEVLIGDDMSTDRTAALAESYVARYAQMKCYSITEHRIQGNGKANVLAELIKKSRGEYIFITDADIQVPPTWIRSMLAGMRDDVVLVTGTSVVGGSGFLALMQRIDWLFATGMLKVVSDLAIPVTTMGNNMVIRRTAYDAIGGYEALPFSVTEDLELFNAIKQRYKTVNIFNAAVLNISKPQNSLKALLAQRKRWMQGAFGLPLVMILLLLLQSSFLAIILALLIIQPFVGLIVLGLKLIFRLVFLRLVVKKLNLRVIPLGSIIFEVFNAIFALVSLIYYLIPGKIVWKERKY